MKRWRRWRPGLGLTSEGVEMSEAMERTAYVI